MRQAMHIVCLSCQTVTSTPTHCHVPVDCFLPLQSSLCLPTTRFMPAQFRVVVALASCAPMEQAYLLPSTTSSSPSPPSSDRRPPCYDLSCLAPLTPRKVEVEAHEMPGLIMHSLPHTVLSFDLEDSQLATSGMEVVEVALLPQPLPLRDWQHYVGSTDSSPGDDSSSAPSLCSTGALTLSPPIPSLVVAWFEAGPFGASPCHGGEDTPWLSTHPGSRHCGHWTQTVHWINSVTCQDNSLVIREHQSKTTGIESQLHGSNAASSAAASLPLSSKSCKRSVLLEACYAMDRCIFKLLPG
jgi:hypothetical protein